MARIVITGSAGFIGSSLAKFFYNLGYSIVGIDNMSYGYSDNLIWAKDCDPKRYSFYTMDVLNKDLVNILEKEDIVIHCAGIAPLPVNQENPSFSITNNVSGTTNVLECSRIKGVKRFILASTGAVYENNYTFPSKETDSIQPTLVYSLGKKFCEDLCHSFFVNYGLEYTICRFFNVYGPHHDFLRKNPPLIAYIVKCFLDNTVPVLHSNGSQKRDYIYIDDLLDLFKCMIENLDICRNKTYNICSNESVSVNEIVDSIQKILNNPIQPIYRNPALLWANNTSLWKGEYTFSTNRLTNEVEKYSLGDYTNALLDFNWKPTVPFQRGIQITVQHMIHLLNSQIN